MSLARAAKSLFGGISPRPTDPARPPRTTLLEIDWEYPQNSSEARAYVDLLAKCRYELDDLARRKGRPAGTYELTVSPPACERRVTTRRRRGLTGGPDGSRAGRRSQRKGQLRQVGYQGDGAVRRFLELDGKPGFVVSNRDHRADVIGLRVDVRCRSSTMDPAPQSCTTLTRTDPTVISAVCRLVGLGLGTSSEFVPRPARWSLGRRGCQALHTERSPAGSGGRR